MEEEGNDWNEMCKPSIVSRPGNLRAGGTLECGMAKEKVDDPCILTYKCTI